MASPEELEETVEATLSRLEADAATIEQHPDSTIVPRTADLDTADERAISMLGELGGATLAGRLELHGTLGEGGMGIVRLGTQRALGRKVAVKTLKEEVKCERTSLKLLREAWVTGALEHPNIVPIYDLALEPDGSPLVVLKKIEGTSWDRLIHDARAVEERFGADDLLEWNLRILMQVCNAVRFAHSRGLLHRDLKPENVMIGEFGEVYLVDWGIAVCLHDDETGRLPLAREARELAGTPVYMAPEMLGGKVSRLSARTDIYLLGAILYEIVAGRPPHRGRALMELVQQILESRPELPEDLSPELRAAIRRAMDPDPELRFESAEELRQALAAFLSHRSASRLAARAGERLRELEALLSELDEDAPLELREPAYHLFGEARFGFWHALDVWPQSEEARDGLQRAVTAMVEFELAQGACEAARALLTELPEVPEALAARVEAARERRLEEEAAARALRDENDPSAGRRTRIFLAVVIGTLWCVVPLLNELAIRMRWLPEPDSHLIPMTVSGVFLALIAGLGLWARESMTRTRMNRILAVATLLAIATPLLVHSVGYAVGSQDVIGAMRDEFLVWAAISTMAAAAVDRRLAIPSAAYALAFVVVVFVPRAMFIALAVCNEILLVTMVVLWFRREDLRRWGQRLEEGREPRQAWLRERFGGSRRRRRGRGT